MKRHAVLIALLILFLMRPVLAHYSRSPTPEQSAKMRQFNLFALAGRAAEGAGDYSDAIIDFRRALSFDDYPPVRVELALMLDYQGEQDEAFAAYQKGFGSPIGSTFGTNGPQMQEAVARYGLMCLDRDRLADAVQCFDTARTWEYSSSMEPLDKTLDAKTSSPKIVRMMLEIARGGGLEDEYLFGRQRSTEALAAFGEAARLVPSDPRAQYFLACGLRRARHFMEAEAALKRTSVLDTKGVLKEATAKSLEYVHEGQSGF
jgi:tetratricopeptide (TPR) repeat protein